MKRIFASFAVIALAAGNMAAAPESPFEREFTYSTAPVLVSTWDFRLIVLNAEQFRYLFQQGKVLVDCREIPIPENRLAEQRFFFAKAGETMKQVAERILAQNLSPKRQDVTVKLVAKREIRMFSLVDIPSEIATRPLAPADVVFVSLGQ